MYYQSLAQLFQIVIALGLLNVWVIRFNRPTRYRGGEARTLPQEFAAYGLPGWAVYAIGFLKVSIALILLGSVCFPETFGFLVLGSLVLLSMLMLGAITMHFKVGDPLRKFIPAVGVLGMALAAVLLLVLAY